MARASAAECAKRVERWRSSGLTAKEFAAETRVNASTLSNWGWRLSRQGATGRNRRLGSQAPKVSAADEVRRRGRADAPQFIELPVVEVAAAPAELEVVVGERIRIRVPAGVDETTLGRVFRAVGVAS